MRGLSANGGKVLLATRSGGLTPVQLFIKDFNGSSSTRVPDPELGDRHVNRRDVFVLDLASGMVHMATTDADGQQLAIQGFASTAGGPSFGVQSFLSDRRGSQSAARRI